MPLENTKHRSDTLNKKAISNQIKKLLEQLTFEFRKKSGSILPLVQEIIKLSKSIKHTNYEALGQLYYAHYVCSIDNNYKKSLTLSDAAFEALNAKFKKIYKPFYHLNRGRAFHFMGEQVNAQEEYLFAIKIIEFSATVHETERRWLASCYYNLFILFNADGVEFSQEEYLKKAFDIYASLNDESGIGNCYNSFAVFYSKKNDLYRTLGYLTKACAFLEKTQNQNILSIVNSNIGLIQAKLGEAKAGMVYFAKSNTINAALKSAYHHGHTNMQQGEAYAIEHNMDNAIHFYKEAERIYTELDVKTSLAIIYKNLSDAFYEKHDFLNAFLYQEKYAQALKNHFNDEKTFAIAKARNNFELEKKEKETEILKHKNEEIEIYAQQLEVSNNQLRQFAHIASHDLKEPLRMISSYTTLLQRSLGNKLTADEQDYVSFISQGTTTMYNLVNDLLVLSNINYIVEKQSVDLNKVLKLVLTSLHTAIVENHAKINTQKLPVVNADETQMLQLFMNLISNAIKYNVSKIPTIKIGCKIKADVYEFSLSDNGIGIPEAYREKVFLIFQRLHTRHEYSGTGIGLTICKKIIDQLKGNMWIEDNKEGGSIFKFTLPISKMA